MSQKLNLIQFSPTTLVGTLDMSIMTTGRVAGVISTGESTLYPGDRVKLDTANTGKIPKFKACTDAQTAIGTIYFNVQKSSYDAGDTVEVQLVTGTDQCMYMEAEEAITPQAEVAAKVANHTVELQSTNSSKRIGYALDPAPAKGDIFRVILTTRTL
jgi:hypothetical protein